MRETYHVQPIIKEAIGFAHSPHRHNLKKDFVRWWLRRAYVLLRNPLLPRSWQDDMFLFILRLSPVGGGSISNTTENDLLKLIFNATTWANMAVDATSSPRTNLSIALHTADPGEAGTQATSECVYTSYLRVLVARTTGGWTVTTNSVSPVANIDFPAATGGSETATFFSVGTATATTAGVASIILLSGAISPTIVISSGVTPRLTTASACTLD